MAASKKKRRIDPQQLSALVGIIAAVVIVILANALAGRSYKRWDWTSNKRYSLSAATIETLRTLPEKIDVWVLMGGADPMEQSVKQLLVAYRSETDKLVFHYIDPDRDVAALIDVRRKFDIDKARTDNGRLVGDAVVIVQRGERHWFLTTADLVEVSNADDVKVKPREEQALTGAIRNVLVDSKTRVCFTSGHGEMNVLDPGAQGLGGLRDVLTKDNYEVKEIESVDVPEPFKGCVLVVVAGMTSAFTKEEAERLKSYALGGGNLLLALSPIPGKTQTGMTSTGLESVVQPFGIELQETVVVEGDAALLRTDDPSGMHFVAIPKQHPVTAGLVIEDKQRNVPRVFVNFARSMKASGAAQEILGTSPNAFGLTSVIGASEGRLTKRSTDLSGPLSIGAAAERPKLQPSDPHGPRIVVLGTPSMLTTPAFQEPQTLRGGAILVESAISWLASKPQVLDVPAKAAVAAGIKMSEQDRSELRRYVLIFMPGALALSGVLVAVARRAGEGKDKKKKKQ